MPPHTALEPRLPELFDTHPVPMFVYDPTTLRFLAVNPAMSERYGYAEAEFLGMSVEALVTADEVARLRAKAEQSRDRPHHASGRWKHRLKDGTVVHAEVTSHATTFGGRPARLVMALDATDRVRAEAAVRASEDRYARVLATTNDGVWDWDVASDRLLVNDRCLEIFGLTRAAFDGSARLFRERIDPAARDAVAAARAAHAADPAGHPYRVECRIRHTSGEWRWVRVRGQIVTADAAGKPLRMVGTHTDITRRKAVEAEREALIARLEARNAELEQFVYTVSHDLKAPLITIKGFVGHLDRSARAGNWDRFAADLGRVGRAADTMQALLTDLLEPSGRFAVEVARALAPARAAIAAAAPDLVLADWRLPDGRGIDLLPPDGAFPVVVMTSFGNEAVAVEMIRAGAVDYLVKSDQLFEHAPGLIDRALRTWEHVVGRRDAERALMESEARTAGIVNTAADAIVTADADGTIETVNPATERTFGYPAADPVVLDPNRVVGDLTRMLQRLMNPGVHLETVLDPAARYVRIDSSHLEQVLLNLAVNARDAIHPGSGTVRVAITLTCLWAGSPALPAGRAPGEYVVLTVSDTGVGMTDDVKARVFEPFFTTKEPGKGTGLGLATVFGVVRHAGGFVTVDSAPRRGSTFAVHLPRVVSEEADALPPDARFVPPGTETVLLADDDPAVQKLARMALESAGYVVLTADDGVEAVEVADRHAPRLDLIVTDLVMPRLGGLGVVTRVRQKRPGLPAVVVSGYPDISAAEEGVHVMRKPFTPAALARKVRDVLDRPKVGGSGA